MTGEVAKLSLLLDLPTLLVVAATVIAMLALVLVFAWMRDRSRALAWWAAAYLVGAGAVGLWSLRWTGLGVGPGPAVLPSALLFLTCGMVWNGARLFQQRRIEPLGMLAGMLVWLLSCRQGDVLQDGSEVVVLSSTIVASYTFLTAFEFWRERRRPLLRHWSAFAVPTLLGGMYLIPGLLARVMPSDVAVNGWSSGWFALFALETLLYAVGTAFVLLLITQERAVQLHKTAALTDPLTGLFNRRAFFDGAARLIARQAGMGGEVAILMFDLDHFKAVNDRFGHLVGDEALRVFAACAAGKLRAGDVLARLGGEEFALVIAGNVADAANLAERLRLAFETAGREFAGYRVDATVSVGVAAMPAAGADVDGLLMRADRALYVAKVEGRNRIAAAGEEGEAVLVPRSAAPPATSAARPVASQPSRA